MSEDTAAPESPRRTSRRRRALRRLGVFLLACAAIAVWSYFTMIRMPGKSHRGALPPITEVELAMAAEMRRDVTALAGEIGPRNVSHRAALADAAAYLEGELAAIGPSVERQVFDVEGVPCANLWIEIPGAAAPDEIVVVGAHYDSCWSSPGANDNGSGAAATLALARRLAGSRPARTLRFVLFVNEEPPYFTGPDMGSLRYALGCRERDEKVVAMLSLETIGYYSDDADSQRYPPPVGLAYPSTGNFIALVGNVRSRRLVRSCVGRFRESVAFPSEGAALPGWLPGIGWSDHWAFWKAGYDAVMVTDTAPFRYPHYHLVSDTPDRIDYERTARVVSGVEAIVRMLADPDQFARR